MFILDKGIICFVFLGIFVKFDYVKMIYLEIQFRYLLFLLLICDNFRDFGNLGTILRFVVGVGCSKVLFIKGKSICYWVDGVVICK